MHFCNFVTRAVQDYAVAGCPSVPGERIFNLKLSISRHKLLSWNPHSPKVPTPLVLKLGGERNFYVSELTYLLVAELKLIVFRICLN